MSAGATHAPGDPGWPALWPDPPWRMSGRHVTARFAVDSDLMRRAVHPLLAPGDAGEAVARVRFWELSFESLAGGGGELGPEPAGTFRELIVAFPARFGDRATESVTFLWTDSQVYLTWGRECFGWPTEMADVSLEGGLWSPEPFAEGASGRAEARMTQGTISLEGLVAKGELPVPAVAANPTFATLRRALQLGHAPGGVEAVLTEMEVLEPGARFEFDGRIEFALAPGHPLHGVEPEALSVEGSDGLTCVVGERVDVLAG